MKYEEDMLDRSLLVCVTWLVMGTHGHTLVLVKGKCIPGQEKPRLTPALCKLNAATPSTEKDMEPTRLDFLRRQVCEWEV